MNSKGYMFGSDVYFIYFIFVFLKVYNRFIGRKNSNILSLDSENFNSYGF